MGAALGMKMQVAGRRRRRLLRRRRRQHRPHLGVHQPGRAVEAPADRGLREQPLRRRDAHLAGRWPATRSPTRASGFGLPAVTVDGQDIVAVNAAAREARERALAGDGPTFIEAQTYRYEGHNVGDVQNYREQSEVRTGAARATRSTGCGELLVRTGRLDDEALRCRRERAPGTSSPTRSPSPRNRRGPTPPTVNRAWPPAAASEPGDERSPRPTARPTGRAWPRR